jgi:hypothetical protein
MAGQNHKTENPAGPKTAFTGGGPVDQKCEQHLTSAVPRAPNRAKRLECVQLAAALVTLAITESAGKPDALQTLRDLDSP